MRKLIVGLIILVLVAVGAAVGVFHYKYEFELSRSSLADAIRERDANEKALAEAVRVRDESNKEAVAIKIEINTLKDTLAKVEKERDAVRLAPVLSQINTLIDLRHKNVAVVNWYIPVELFYYHEIGKDFTTVFGLTADEKARLQGIVDDAYLEVSKANGHRAKVERRSADVVEIALPADPMKQIDCLYQHVLDDFTKVLGPDRMAGVMEFSARELRASFGNQNLPECVNMNVHTYVVTKSIEGDAKRPYVVYYVDYKVFDASGNRAIMQGRYAGSRPKIYKSFGALADLLPTGF